MSKKHTHSLVLPHPPKHPPLVHSFATQGAASVPENNATRAWTWNMEPSITNSAELQKAYHQCPTGTHPYPTRYQVFFRYPTRFTFENLWVAGNPIFRVNPKFQVLHDVGVFPDMIRYFRYTTRKVLGKLLWNIAKGTMDPRVEFLHKSTGVSEGVS